MRRCPPPSEVFGHLPSSLRFFSPQGASLSLSRSLCLSMSSVLSAAPALVLFVCMFSYLHSSSCTLTITCTCCYDELNNARRRKSHAAGLLKFSSAIYLPFCLRLFFSPQGQGGSLSCSLLALALLVVCRVGCSRSLLE